MTSRDWRFCRPCIYSLIVGNYHICDFIGQTGHCRNCPAGIGCERFTPFDKGRAFDLWFIGLTDKDAALVLRCTRQTMTQWRRDLGLAQNERKEWFYPMDVLARAGIRSNGS